MSMTEEQWEAAEAWIARKKQQMARRRLERALERAQKSKRGRTEIRAHELEYILARLP